MDKGNELLSPWFVIFFGTTQ